MSTWKIGGTAVNDLNLKITKVIGVGDVDPVLQFISYAGLDGAHYDGQHTPKRDFTLHLISQTGSEDLYHQARNNLSSLLRRYRLVDDTPTTVQYVSDGTAGGTVQIDAYFAGGMGLDEPKGYKEKVILSFSADSPWWEATSEGTVSLNAPGTLTFNNVAMKVGKAGWDTMGGGLDNYLWDVTFSPDGSTIISGGNYTGFGTATGTANYLAYYINGTWTELGGGVDGLVHKTKFKSGTNKLWTCGAFGSVNVNVSGTAAAGIAYYNFDDTSWSTLSEGGTAGIPSSTVIDFDWDAEENLVIGGNFTKDNFHNVVAYDVDGGSFTYLTEGKPGDVGDGTAVYGLNSHVYVVKRINTDEYTSGTVRTYLGGAYSAWEDSAGAGSTANYTSYFIWRDYGHSFVRGFKNAAGSDGCVVYGIEEAPDGRVWFCGNFDNEATRDTGIKDLYRVARYDGTRMENMDVGDTDERVYKIKYSSYHKGMFAVGTFTEAGGDNSIKKAAFHTGSVWAPEQLDLSAVTVSALAVNGSTVVYGFSGTATAYVSETTVNNTGSAPAEPIFELTGPGVLTYIYNETTDQIIQFSGLTLYSGETITVDLRKGQKAVSSDFRSNVTRFVVDGGDFDTFYLTAGNNIVKLNHGTALATRQVRFTPRYLSVDDIY